MKINYLKMRGRELLAYPAYHLLPNSETQKRVVIFTQGRSGSTLLSKLLSSTNHFYENGELFNHGVWGGEIRNPATYVTGFARLKRSSHFLFNLQYMQMVKREKPVNCSGVLEDMLLNGWKIIHLVRKNIINQTLSYMIALETGRFHKRDDKAEKLKITINRDLFIERAKLILDLQKTEQEILKSCDYFSVEYERDLEQGSSHQVSIDRILDHLDLERKPIHVDLNKINVFQPHELIANYDEFVGIIEENDWGRYLETESSGN